RIRNPGVSCCGWFVRWCLPDPGPLHFAAPNAGNRRGSRVALTAKASGVDNFWIKGRAVNRLRPGDTGRDVRLSGSGDNTGLYEKSSNPG
ncbi:MAG: hypothetical protein KJ740_07120, partial [Gammaproteobacteria bacterium]|nr:hypothetical protein [Gammaproteobacteria bacterium]